MRGRLATVAIPTAVVALLMAGAPGASAQFDGTPTLQSLTVSSPSVDVTTAAKDVTITVRATDPVQLRGADGGVELVPSTGLAGGDIDFAGVGFSLAEVSGTATDKTYRGTVRLPAGASGRYQITLNLYGSGPNGLHRIHPEDLRAAGQPDGIDVVTRSVPAKLAKVTGRTVTSTSSSLFGTIVNVTGVVEFTLGSGGGAVRSVEVVSASPSCGTLYPILPPGRTGKFENPANGRLNFLSRGVGLCTVSVREVNGAGSGPASSVTFW